MKKITPLHTFITLIVAAILIPLLNFGWNELQKQPLDLTMHGAEIKADGTVIEEIQFQIKGYVKEDHHYNWPVPVYLISLEPVNIPASRELRHTMAKVDYENSLAPIGDIHTPYYCSRWFTLGQNTGTMEICFCRQLCCCLIISEGRYFVGSSNQNRTTEEILALFPDAISND